MTNSHAPSSHSLESEFYRIVNGRALRRSQKLKRWVQALVDFLTGAQSLSIREKMLKNGTSLWIVYEPISDTRLAFDTEQAVRVWIETRSLA